MSTAIIDFIASGFSFFSITFAAIALYAAIVNGSASINGNFIFITFFIYFFTKALSLFKAIINKEQSNTNNQIAMNNFCSIAAFVLSLLSLGMYFVNNDVCSIIVLIICHAFVTFVMVYDISIFTSKLSLYQKTK